MIVRTRNLPNGRWIRRLDAQSEIALSRSFGDEGLTVLGIELEAAGADQAFTVWLSYDEVKAIKVMAEMAKRDYGDQWGK